MRELIRDVLVLLIVTVFPLLSEACGRQSAPAAVASSSATPEAYVPGLGDIMSLQQMRHVKLWLAGQAGNWDLAAYEVDELGEGFDDIVKFHPTHKDSPSTPRTRYRGW